MSCSMALRRSPNPGCLDGGALEHPADLIDDQCRERLALDLLGDEEDGLARFRDLLEERQHVLEDVELAIADEDAGILDHLERRLDGLRTRPRRICADEPGAGRPLRKLLMALLQLTEDDFCEPDDARPGGANYMGNPKWSTNRIAWAVILAAGEGSRLRALTTLPSGIAIPKQFCSLYEGPSLLEEALRRGESVADKSRICAVVAEQHRLLVGRRARVIARPQCDRTAAEPGNGERHSAAADAHSPARPIRANRPAALRSSRASGGRADSFASRCARAARLALEETLLLGIQPGEVDPDLGYILPGGTDGRGALTVARFIEKPPHAVADELIRAGGLWNAFIVVTTAGALLDLFRQRIPQVVAAMRAAVQRDREQGSGVAAVAELYRRLPIIDFSRDIVAGQESKLRVLPVRPCGWSDLGTPKRVAEVLERARRAKAALPGKPATPAHVSLAAQHERMQARGYCNRAAAAQ